MTTTNTDKCTRRRAVDVSIRNADLPNKYRGTWSFIDTTGAVQNVFRVVPMLKGFVEYMNAQPFIVITKGKANEREDVAAAILKQTFAYNFTRMGWKRALYADAFQMFSQREFELAEEIEDAAQIRTLVLLEVQNVASNRQTYLQSLMRQRNDRGRYTIITVPHINDIPLDVKEIVQDAASVISIG